MEIHGWRLPRQPVRAPVIPMHWPQSVWIKPLATQALSPLHPSEHFWPMFVTVEVADPECLLPSALPPYATDPSRERVGVVSGGKGSRAGGGESAWGTGAASSARGGIGVVQTSGNSRAAPGSEAPHGSDRSMSWPNAGLGWPRGLDPHGLGPAQETLWLRVAGWPFDPRTDERPGTGPEGLLRRPPWVRAPTRRAPSRRYGPPAPKLGFLVRDSPRLALFSNAS